MAEQRNEPSFEQRLARLDDAVTRAVHVAAMLKIASRPEPSTSPSRLGAWRKKILRESERDPVVVRPAQLNAQAQTPPEVTHWLLGLKDFHTALSQASAVEVPDRDVLLRQLERQVDELTSEVGRATDFPTKLIGDAANWATQKARLDPEILEGFEERLRERLDRATGHLVPERSVHGVFTGMVANRILNYVGDDTLVRTGDALRRSNEPGRLSLDEPDGAGEIEAPAHPGGVPPEAAWDAASDALTPTDLDELDVPERPGALRKLVPTAPEEPPADLPDGPRAPGGDGEVELDRLIDEATRIADDPRVLGLAEGEPEGPPETAPVDEQGLQEPDRPGYEQ